MSSGQKITWVAIALVGLLTSAGLLAWQHSQSEALWFWALWPALALGLLAWLRLFNHASHSLQKLRGEHGELKHRLQEAHLEIERLKHVAQSAEREKRRLNTQNQASEEAFQSLSGEIALLSSELALQMQSVVNDLSKPSSLLQTLPQIEFLKTASHELQALLQAPKTAVEQDEFYFDEYIQEQQKTWREQADFAQAKFSLELNDRSIRCVLNQPLLSQLMTLIVQLLNAFSSSAKIDIDEVTYVDGDLGDSIRLNFKTARIALSDAEEADWLQRFVVVRREGKTLGPGMKGLLISKLAKELGARVFLEFGSASLNVALVLPSGINTVDEPDHY